MMFGKCNIDGDVVDTHQGHYFLEPLDNLLSPRVFMGPGLMIAAAASSFVWSFWDILWPGERLALVVLASLALIAALAIRQLRFISRDLTQAQQSCVIYGLSHTVVRKRYEIAAARQRLLREHRETEGKANG